MYYVRSSAKSHRQPSTDCELGLTLVAGSSPFLAVIQ